MDRHTTCISNPWVPHIPYTKCVPEDEKLNQIGHELQLLKYSW